MTQIDFYILPEESEAQRQAFACRLAEKAFRLGHRIYIYAGDQSTAESMDQLLWSFKSSSFLPHSILDAHKDEPIAIGWQTPPDSFHDLLLNLSSEIPSFFSRFQRVSELVANNDQANQRSREHYRFYRDRGYQLNNHSMRSKPASGSQ